MSISINSPPSEGLPDLPGIDTTIGLGYVAGKRDFYLRLLKKFRDGHGMTFVENFRRARSANDWPTAVRMAHTLKSLARSIGATELSLIAGQLEQAAKRHEIENVIALENVFEEEMSRIMPGLMRLDEFKGISINTRV